MSRFSDAVNKWGFRIMFPPAAMYSEAIDLAIELNDVCVQISMLSGATRQQVYERVTRRSGESLDSLLETAALMHVDAMLGVPWNRYERDDPPTAAPIASLNWVNESKSGNRRVQRLQQRLNRISNLMIGNERIWNLDRLAMELDVEADLIDAALIDDLALADTDEDKMMSSDDRATRYNQGVQLRADALFLRRLEWDLGELHTAVRGATNRRGGRFDQSEWRGQRP